MISLIRCDSDSKDFCELIELLDSEIQHRDGNIYNGLNVIPFIDTVVIVKDNNFSIGCGCIKKYNDYTVEIKRMYVRREYRSQGIGKKILLELEKWAKELDYSKAILQTGSKHIEAIGLYNSYGYNRIDNYGQYIGTSDSICFEKILI